MEKEMSNEKYQEKMNIARSNEPQVLATTLSNIIIEPDSFDKNYIILILDTKHQLTVSDSFFKQLAKILNVNLKIRQNLTDEKDDNKIYSDLLNALKTIQSSVKPVDVTILYDPAQKKITDIKAGAYTRLSNSSLFAFAEELVSKHHQLSISNVDAFQGTPDVGIQIMSGNIVDLTNKKISSDDESFQFGITLGNSGLVTSVGDFAYRLVCSNGMMGIRTDERFFLKNTEADGLLYLYNHFSDMEKDNFIPADFAANFENATNINASYKELKKAHDFAQNNLIIEFEDLEFQTRQAFTDKFFRDIAVVQAKLKSKGVIESEIPEKAMELIRTRTSMWDLVNTMTDLGSNDHNAFKMKNKRAFQKHGGKLMSANWDLEYEKYLLM